MVSCEIEWIRERMSNLGESGILSLNEFVHSLGGTNCRFGYRGDEVTRNSTIRESTLAHFLSLCDPGRAKTPNLGHPVKRFIDGPLNQITNTDNSSECQQIASTRKR